MGVEREVSGKFHQILNTCLRPIANKYYEGWKGSELDQFSLVRLAHDAGIHVGVCVVACIVRQDPSSHVNKNFVGGSRSLSVCVHASED